MRIVCVPGTLALLQEYASIDDPIAELRAAALAAVQWLVEDGPAIALAATPAGEQIAAQLLGEAQADGGGVLVIANGSATRTEKAPGHFDERAESFDKAIGQALRAGDSPTLAALDPDLAADLWADVDGLRSLGREIDLAGAEVSVDYDDAPHGVQYWVVRYQCGS
jgi:hypothetical protein